MVGKVVFVMGNIIGRLFSVFEFFGKILMAMRRNARMHDTRLELRLNPPTKLNQAKIENRELLRRSKTESKPLYTL